MTFSHHMDIKKYPVILCAYSGFNGYGMLRSLGEGGVHPIIVTNKIKNQILRSSKYATRQIYYFKNDEDVISILRKIRNEYDYKPIVICCEDKLQALVDKNYDELNNSYILSNCGKLQGDIVRLMDKEIQMKIAKECDLDVPKSWSLKRNDNIPSDIIYPCIIKPLISTNGSKSEIKICINEEELKNAISKNDYLIQEFIVKDYEISLWGCSLEDNKYFIPFVNKKIRMYPDEFTLSSYGTVDNFDKYPGLDKTKIFNFMKKLKYKGMFAIDMMVKGNKYYLLEVNLRNGGKQYFSTKAGANLPLIYINNILGNEINASDLNYSLPMHYMGELTDIRQVFNHKISFLRWLKDLFKTNCFFYFNWKDPKPFFTMLKGKFH